MHSLSSTCSGVFDPATDEAVLRSRATSEVRGAIFNFRDLRYQQYKEQPIETSCYPYQEEYRVTLIVAPVEGMSRNKSFEEKFTTYVHITILPPLPTPPVRAVVRIFSRRTPGVKDIQWTRDRKALESELPLDANEAILQDLLGDLTEGLSSNFFVWLMFFFFENVGRSFLHSCLVPTMLTT